MDRSRLSLGDGRYAIPGDPLAATIKNQAGSAKIMNDNPPRFDMFCLGCDYPLHGLTSRRCPECGRKFDPNDLVTVQGRLALEKQTLLCKTTDSMQAHLLCNALNEQGVPSLFTDTGGGFTSLFGASIWVSAVDIDRAQKMIDSRARAPADGVDDRTGKGWKCPQCGEIIEAVFALCWNCETQRPDQEDEH